MDFVKGKEFIYRNARPLDLARWKFFFENGTKEEVLECLSFYQNKDGGFGHALEADVWNPNSFPIGTWRAAEIIAELGGVSAKHPMIIKILSYLEGKDGFDYKTEQWTYTVPSNNDYPHAVWWEHKDMPKEFDPNPNASLAGFIVTYADKESGIYQFGIKMVKRSFDYMVEHCPIQDEHVIGCYISLYNYLINSQETMIVDMEKFKECLCKMVDSSLCLDFEKWGKEYVPMPSTFFSSPDSFLYNGREDLAVRECELIQKQQLDDGSFLVPWSWWTDYKEYEIAVNWWKSELIIKKLLFFKKFSQKSR